MHRASLVGIAPDRCRIPRLRPQRLPGALLILTLSFAGCSPAQPPDGGDLPADRSEVSPFATGAGVGATVGVEPPEAASAREAPLAILPVDDVSASEDAAISAQDSDRGFASEPSPLNITVFGNERIIPSDSTTRRSADLTFFLPPGYPESDLASEPTRYFPLVAPPAPLSACPVDQPSEIVIRTRAVTLGADVVHAYVIRNDGDTELTLRTVQVPEGFFLITPPAARLEPGGSTRFEIQLDTRTTGIKTGVVSISNADSAPWTAVSEMLNPSLERVRIESPAYVHAFAIAAAVDREYAPQEFVVCGNGSEISNGASHPTPLDHTDFGTYYEDLDPLLSKHAFTIRNPSADTNLLLDAVDVPDGFILVTPPDRLLGPGEYTVFEIQPDFSVPGERNGEVVIHAEDAAIPAFAFAIQGDVAGPRPARINVLANERNIYNRSLATSSEDHTDFGSVRIGADPIVRTFTIRNTGGQPLTLGPIFLPQGFTLVRSPSAVVEPGETTSFEVQLDTGSAGAKGGELAFGHDAQANLNPFAFTIRGVVAAD